MNIDIRGVVWSNAELNYEDWREDIEADYPGISEDKGTQLMYERNADYLDDERMNLDIQLEGPIICIADLGLWNGRHTGYRMINSGNIKDCLSGVIGEQTTWFVDRFGNFKCKDAHHDGTNYYTYRVWKPGITEARKEAFLEKLYEGIATTTDMTVCTRRIGDKVAAVYGWKVR